MTTTKSILEGLRSARKAVAVGGNHKLLSDLRRRSTSKNVEDRQVALLTIGYLLRKTS